MAQDMDNRNDLDTLARELLIRATIELQDMDCDRAIDGTRFDQVVALATVIELRALRYSLEKEKRA